MDAPDIPRSRDGKHRRLGSTLTSFVKYPHQANGKRELKAMSSQPNDDRPPTSASTTRARPMLSSVNTAVRMPTGHPQAEAPSPPGEEPKEPLVEDFQDRYTTQPSYPNDRTQFAQSKPMSSPDSERPPNSPDFSDFDDTAGHGQQEYTTRGMHVPSRTSSRQRQQSRPRQARSRRQSFTGHDTSTPTTPEAETMPARMYGTGDRSSADSIFSQETAATSVHTLPPLQTKGPDNSDAQQLEPVLEDDPRSFDLVVPLQEGHQVGMYAMERRSEQLFSSNHLQEIFDDPRLLLKFTGFLNSHRPQSIPILIYYLDALKALRAISYANAIAEALEPIKGHGFTNEVTKPTGNGMLEEKANEAFGVLAREDLPAYVAHTWIQVVSVSIQRRITGTLAPHLREASEGLAEVFCLTDPSRPDNPIVFASEEFARTTQYGMGYTVGRNCRFLQGPRTNPHSVKRLAQACAAGKEHSEVFLNYRRDGSPFMNLLLIAPLMDSRGNIRYFIGAQVDVSGLIKDCSDLDGLARLAEKEQDPEAAAEEEEMNGKDEFQELSEMFNGTELETVRRCGGRMHKEYVDESDTESLSHGRPRLLLKDPTQDLLDRQRDSSVASVRSAVQKDKMNGRLEGVYQNYLLVRPAPSLRILFTSPSLRVPGILQSPFLNRIGGSSRVRTDLAAALGEGRGVTAKIRWLTKADEDGEGEGRPRWIHCTPLLGHSGAVGVWMIVLVDEEGSDSLVATGRRFRAAPPVASTIGGKEWDASRAHHARSTERKQLNGYAKENERRGGAYPGGGAGVVSSRAERDYYSAASGRPSTNGKDSHVAGQSDRSRNGTPRRNDVESIGDASEFSFSIKTPSENPKKFTTY
ncbi:hypothetical protein LTR36_001245 [Oleoguttula mirabilis]|uniref:PAC domain-containing protein n=1 Tax=Oleoguttula mirabilis TaxID=1507867 RepID=A0AAV9JNS4_9PEZI|nr:hypothetical protein LTR36_001245 [Oleoguttula mirabilis]